jgi:hypothetical protein
MASEPEAIPTPEHGGGHHDAVELPGPTVAPLVLCTGVTLLAGGVAFGNFFFVTGVVVLASGLGLWVKEMRPGRGHVHEPLVEAEQRPAPVAPTVGAVEHLREGMPGYRFRLPEKVHPISAGVKGGIVGGILMPLPAFLWSVISGNGPWYPVNLLAGMVLPGVGRMTVAELQEFHLGLLALGLAIHAVMTVVIGLIYGVLLPTLPSLPRPVSWGGLLMPILWTAVTYTLMGFVNPVLQKGVDWPWFIASQFVFGLVAAAVVLRFQHWPHVMAGLLGGAVGGVVMSLPAMLWALATGHSIWYPINLLVGTVIPNLPLDKLNEFRPEWFFLASILHVGLSLGFGVVYGLILPNVKPIPAPMAWGGLLLPLVWTGMTYGMMGVVDPLLQNKVDWPWFIASQFIFGIVAAVVVIRSEMVYIPPAGQAPSA